MEVGALLKHSDSSVPEWLDAMAETHVLISAVLFVIHPEQYTAALESLRGVMHIPGVTNALAHWQLPFNALTCIFNRCTPPHRDSAGHPRMLDLLFNVGSHQENSLMKLAGLGLSFRYRSGSTLAFSGLFFRHEAIIQQGNRICIAYYMRRNVWERSKVDRPGWMSWSTFCPSPPTHAPYIQPAQTDPYAQGPRGTSNTVVLKFNYKGPATK